MLLWKWIYSRGVYKLPIHLRRYYYKELLDVKKMGEQEEVKKVFKKF